jgi:hypothetical protein
MWCGVQIGGSANRKFRIAARLGPSYSGSIAQITLWLQKPHREHFLWMFEYDRNPENCWNETSEFQSQPTCILDITQNPIVPVRKSVPVDPLALRYRMAYGSSLLSDVLNVFLRVVLCGPSPSRSRIAGVKVLAMRSVTLVQWFGHASNLAPTLPQHGAGRAADENDRPEFHELPPPDGDDVLPAATVVGKILQQHRCVARKRSNWGPYRCVL